MQRNVVERAINKLKGHRAVATRYEKRDYMFRGTIDVASIRIQGEAQSRFCWS